MVNVGSLAPSDLPETIYAYPDPIYTVTVASGYWGTVLPYQLKRTQGVMRYTLMADTLTLSGGTTPTSLVSNLVPVITHVQVQADDDTLFDVDMVLWLEYQRLVQGLQTAQTGYEFDIDMADMNYRARGDLLPATLLRSFQYAQVQMNITMNTQAAVASGSPTTVTTKLHLTETDVNRDLIQNLPVFVVKKLQGTSTLVASTQNSLTQAFPQTGLLKAALFASQSSASAAYGNLVDNTIGNLQLTLNDSFNETTTTWTMLKKQNKALFGTAPNTGFALKIWSPTAETGKFLNISDTQKVTSVNLQPTEIAGNTATLTVLRIFYK
jgi:hypothetical protein